VVDNQRLYSTLLVIATLLHPVEAIAQNSTRWRGAIEEHIHNSIPDLPDATERMGLQVDWHEQAEWQALNRKENR